ncbi:MAG: hypothetical protein KJT01_07520 [Gemmatimonadetes bacterium]|nr:hypothetical protein [Gemmatimonadota bacterium]
MPAPHRYELASEPLATRSALAQQVRRNLLLSVFALVPGVLFISSTGFILAPVAHRFFRRLHVDA